VTRSTLFARGIWPAVCRQFGSAGAFLVRSTAGSRLNTWLIDMQARLIGVDSQLPKGSTPGKAPGAW